MNAGMPWMRNSPAISGISSVLSLATTSEPRRWSASFSISGPTMRQGPHQGAQKSTSTGKGDWPMSSRNSAAFGIAYGLAGVESGDLHWPQRAFWSSRAAGTRFSALHDEQITIMSNLLTRHARRAYRGRTKVSTAPRFANPPGLGSPGTGRKTLRNVLEWQVMSDFSDSLNDTLEQVRGSRLNTSVAILVSICATFVALCNVKDGNILQAMAHAQANQVDAPS